MRVLITGIRDFVDARVIPRAAEDSGFNVTRVVTGSFFGVEQQVSAWAEGAALPVTVYKPDWMRHRLRAGDARNDEMLDACDAVIVIWTGVDKSKLVVDAARKRRLPLHLHHV